MLWRKCPPYQRTTSWFWIDSPFTKVVIWMFALLHVTQLTLSSSSDVPGRSLLVALVPGLTVREHPGTGRVIGAMPARSKYYGVPLVAWVLRTSQGGRYGEVAVPFSPTHAVGWIPLRGLRRTFNRIEVKISVSRHRLSVYRSGRSVRTFVVGTGASWSPTPPGDYFVTDRVPFPAGSALGWFAFGISGVQPQV